MEFQIWMLYMIVAIAAIVIEIFAPSMFFINFALAGVITALISLIWGNFTQLLIVFVILSLLSIWLVKPFFISLLNKAPKEDFNSQYIGKVVKCIEPITKTSGAVTIYDERWEARLESSCDEIPVGCDVKIIKNDSLILFVEKI